VIHTRVCVVASAVPPLPSPVVHATFSVPVRCYSEWAFTVASSEDSELQSMRRKLMSDCSGVVRLLVARMCRSSDCRHSETVGITTRRRWSQVEVESNR